MNKFIFGLGAALLALALTGDVKANGPHGGHGRVGIQAARVVTARPYYMTHGVRHNGGYIYRGQDHHHWSYRVWNTRYNRYQYYDPTLRSYYYWNSAQSSYCPCDCN